jgi:hypothetical protein
MDKKKSCIYERGNYIVYDRERNEDKRKDDKKQEEVNCRIKIEDSIVLLLCGDVDVERIRN